MRDEKRIDVILKEISDIWHKYPDLRLGQLIGNVLEGPSLYYVEDDGLVNALKCKYNEEYEPIDFDIDAYVLNIIKKYPDELGFVLQSKNYEDYLATYETVSEDPKKDVALNELEFNSLKNYFKSNMEQ